MTPRERVMTTLRHQEPDRVPFDLGSTGSTGINADTYVGLRKLLGLPEREPFIRDVKQHLAVAVVSLNLVQPEHQRSPR